MLRGCPGSVKPCGHSRAAGCSPSGALWGQALVKGTMPTLRLMAVGAGMLDGKRANTPSPTAPSLKFLP